MCVYTESIISEELEEPRRREKKKIARAKFFLPKPANPLLESKRLWNQ